MLLTGCFRQSSEKLMSIRKAVTPFHLNMLKIRLISKRHQIRGIFSLCYRIITTKMWICKVLGPYHFCPVMGGLESNRTRSIGLFSILLTTCNRTYFLFFTRRLRLRKDIVHHCSYRRVFGRQDNEKAL